MRASSFKSLVSLALVPLATPPAQFLDVQNVYLVRTYVVRKSGTFSALVFSQSSSVLEKLCRVPGMLCDYFPVYQVFGFGIFTRLGTDAGTNSEQVQSTRNEIRKAVELWVSEVNVQQYCCCNRKF